MKILLATDGSPCSETAAAQVAGLPWPAGTEVRIISVVEMPAPVATEPFVMVPPDYLAEVEKALRESAQGAVERAEAKFRGGRAEGAVVVRTKVLAGSAKRAIVEEAEQWGAELVVVGSHGYRGWERLLLGSVSQSVVTHAGCSVLVVREKKIAGGGDVGLEE